MDKFYSVVTETFDGEKRDVAIRGQSPGDAFQQVKAMPGVRRVGRVSEISAGEHEALVSGKPKPAPVVVAPPQVVVEREQKGDDRRAALGYAISGPRVVIDVQRRAGEKPFKHLQPPPERPEAPKPVQKQAAAAPPVNVEVKHDAAEEAAGTRAYRIVKSRRRDGQPYLLQRGRGAKSTGGGRLR